MTGFFLDNCKRDLKIVFVAMMWRWSLSLKSAQIEHLSSSSRARVARKQAIATNQSTVHKQRSRQPTTTRFPIETRSQILGDPMWKVCADFYPQEQQWRPRVTNQHTISSPELHQTLHNNPCAKHSDNRKQLGQVRLHCSNICTVANEAVNRPRKWGTTRPNKNARIRTRLAQARTRTCSPTTREWVAGCAEQSRGGLQAHAGRIIWVLA